MAATMRAYKLQEFVAHASNVNCLKIGRKTSRVLVTGGEDHKVNLWSIGKPNSILSLSGHTSAVESVNFDSAEVLVAAGAASGSIKLWDLEEAKIVRTLMGHRSNCISVDFHPFGEFFASGSLDTNLKIWDIRKKGCIHTYKGHTRGVNAIRFTPDGRWVVSGGQDNTVKLWDLTAGKLLHDFKCHDGQIQCIDFHPHEFLLATGSADRTVKFWDLETFELIGSAGPETAGVRAMTFNPDGRTLLCGLHESLKVLSWEPIRYHDGIDVGWSTLSDLNIHEGKLLGCSYNQGCVGVWVVDISQIEPYAVGNSETKAVGSARNDTSESRAVGSARNDTSETRAVGSARNDTSETRAVGSARNDNSVPRSTTSVPSVNLPLQTRDSVKASMGRLSISQNSEPATREIKPIASPVSAPSTPQRTGNNNGTKVSGTIPAAASGLKRSSSKSQGTTNRPTFNKSDVIMPVIVARTNSRMELASDSRKDTGGGKTLPYNMQSKMTEPRKFSNIKDDSGATNTTGQSEIPGNRIKEPREAPDQNCLSTSNGVNQPTISGEGNTGDARDVGTGRLGVSPPMEPSPSQSNENYDIRVHKPRDASSSEVLKGGRTRSLVASWERREQSSICGESIPSSSPETVPATNKSYTLRRTRSFAEKETVSATDEDAIADLMDQHEQFINSAQFRLTKLQVVRRVWERNDVKGVISAIEKISDYAVSADVLSVLMAKSDTITLELCTCLLPLITCLLDCKVERQLGIFLEMALKLVRTFGPVIHSTVSATRSSVGVDLQQEQRMERCNKCFIELEKIKRSLPALIRSGGTVAKSAMALNLALQEVL